MPKVAVSVNCCGDSTQSADTQVAVHPPVAEPAPPLYWASAAEILHRPSQPLNPDCVSAGGQIACNFNQYSISNVVSVLVIDLFKVVYIHQS